MKKQDEAKQQRTGPTPKATTKSKSKNDNSRLPNYMALIAIAPPVLSIMAYEFLDYMVYLIHPWRNDYQPINGLGMLIPMALMMEAITCLFSWILLRKVNRITTAIQQIAAGDFHIRISKKHMAPFNEVVDSLNQMTTELQSVETLRNDFINDFSHEFKTPIVSINGFAQLLLDTELPPEEQREYLQIIAEESERLANMAKQTMLLSSLDKQSIVPNKQTYSLDEQLRQTIILLSRDWEAKNIDLQLNLEKAQITADPHLTSHIWINLLNNAIKFTPAGGNISVSLTRLPDSVQVEIRDSGKGMTQEECARIFDRYYQADRSHSGKGLGLGLSIVQKSVTLCGGSIQVESQPQKGSTFIVNLPANN